jgi:hypothetical protein
MKCAAIFGGLAAILGLVGPAAARQNDPAPQAKVPKRGYQVTEHVKKYYESARR